MSRSEGRLIGRRHELVALRGLVDGLGRRSGGGWTRIVGEPGIGKSTLLGAVADRADRAGCLVLGGGGAELERDVPYGVLVNALDDYLGGLVDTSVLASLGDQTLDVLRRVFPALNLTEELDLAVGDHRYRIHRALRALLGRLAASRPLVLVLDDLHWADAASREAIVHLVRQPPAAPVLLALAWRVGQAPVLESALADVARQRPGLEMMLSPLSEAEVAEMLGDEVAPATRALIYRESGGNPFYAQQLAVTGESIAGAQSSAGSIWGVPAPVLAAVRGEIERLSPAGHQLIRGGAVAGDPFNLELAAACGELDDQRSLETVDELLVAGLVRPTESPRRFAFRHPLVRRAVLDWAGSGWALSAHERAARALAGWNAPIALRAHHLARSARSGDLDAAALLARAAALVQGHSPASAAEWGAAGLTILPGAAEHDELRIELLVTVAAARGALGELEEARAALVQALDLVGDDPAAVALLSEVARIEHLLGHWETARGRLLSSLERLDGARVVDQAALELELGLSSLFWIDFAGADERASRAERLAAGADATLHAAALALRAFGAACAGQTAAARPLAVEAARAVDALSDEELVRRLDVTYYLGRSEYLLEDFAAGERHLRRGIHVARATGGSPHLMNLMVEHARALAVCGRLAEAEEAADLAVGTLRLSGQGWQLGLALAAQLSVLSEVGELAAAASAGRQAVELIEATPAGELALEVRRRLAIVELEADRPERFLELMSAAGTPDEGVVAPGTGCLLLEALVRGELACQRLDAARRWAELAEAAAGDLGLDLSSAFARRARARVLLADGDSRGAAAGADEARRLAARAGAPVEAARCRALSGEARAQAGERDNAIAQLRDAANQLWECGARREYDRVVQRLRGLGARVASHRSARPVDSRIEVLSGREREVAELVAVGQTNRQIAEALFLSPRTVETHLARICAKLDVSGRAAVAAAVERSRATAPGAEVQGAIQGSPG